MRRRIAIFLLFLLLTGLASGAIAAAQGIQPTVGTPLKLDEYKLRPGDILSISVLGYDEFVPPANASGPPGFLVRPDGLFSFPLIGEVLFGVFVAGSHVVHRHGRGSVPGVALQHVHR